MLSIVTWREDDKETFRVHDAEFDGRIVYALRKSKARRIVLSYLSTIYPCKSYPSEIARKTGLRANEVCGALNGSPKRYKKENSLVKLGLVKKEESESLDLYVVTEMGRKVLSK